MGDVFSTVVIHNGLMNHQLSFAQASTSIALSIIAVSSFQTVNAQEGWWEDTSVGRGKAMKELCITARNTNWTNMSIHEAIIVISNGAVKSVEYGFFLTEDGPALLAKDFCRELDRSKLK